MKKIKLDVHTVNCDIRNISITNGSHDYKNGVCTVCHIARVPEYTVPSAYVTELPSEVSTGTSSNNLTVYDAIYDVYGQVLLEGISNGLGLINVGQGTLQRKPSNLY